MPLSIAPARMTAAQSTHFGTTRGWRPRHVLLPLTILGGLAAPPLLSRSAAVQHARSCSAGPAALGQVKGPEGECSIPATVAGDFLNFILWPWSSPKHSGSNQ